MTVESAPGPPTARRVSALPATESRPEERPAVGPVAPLATHV